MLPFVKQQENIDCGAACLSMICQHYGYKGTLGYFRRVVKTDINGANLYGMIEGANEVGLDAEALEGDLISLKEEAFKGNISFPFVATVINGDFFHYIVVYEMGRKYMKVADPSTRIKKISYEEFERIYTGYIIQYNPNEIFKKKNDRKKAYNILGDIWKENIDYIIVIIFLSACISIISMLGSMMFGYVVDSLYDTNKGVTGKKLQSNYQIIMNFIKVLPNMKVVFLGIGGLYFLSFFLGLARDWLQEKMSKDINLPFLTKYLQHILHLPISFSETRKTGDVMSRFFEPVGVSASLVSIILTIFIDGILALFYGFYMFTISKELFAIAMIMLFFMGILLYVFKNRMKELNIISLQKKSEINSFLKENIESFHTLKAFGMEERSALEGKKLVDDLFTNRYKGNKINLLQSNLSNLISTLGIIIMLAVGMELIKDGHITSGTVITFYVILGNFLNPIQNLIGLQSQIQNIMVMTERIYDIMEIKQEEITKGIKRVEEMGDIVIQDVNFRYGANDCVLNGLSMQVKKKSKTAIIGESGCGKSTLVKLLLGMYSPEQGNIQIGKYRIDELSKKLLRKKIAYVSQEIYLFNTSLKNNIVLYDDIEDSELDKLIKICCLSDLCEKLPSGVNTKIGENGMNLSGGERQKIAIARALYKKPEILILDEATSHLDSVSERKIVDVIHGELKETTVITIAHRLSTIEGYDYVYYMKKGKIVQEGTYKKIQSKNHLFQNYR